MRRYVCIGVWCGLCSLVAATCSNNYAIGLPFVVFGGTILGRFTDDILEKRYGS